MNKDFASTCRSCVNHKTEEEIKKKREVFIFVLRYICGMETVDK